MNHNEFAKKQHARIVELGYWDNERTLPELLMLVVTEITKLYDINKLNKAEKIADTALRLYDLAGKYNIDLSELPEVSDYSLWGMLFELTCEVEAYRSKIPTGYQYIKNCLSMCFKYAENNGIDLEQELYRKWDMLPNVKIKLI